MSGFDDEIREVEARIAHERAESLEAFDTYKDHLVERATSFGSLAALVAVGYAAGKLLQLRMKRAPATPGMGLFSLAASAATAIASAQSRRRDVSIADRIGPRARARPAEGEGFLAVDQARGGAT